MVVVVEDDDEAVVVVEGEAGGEDSDDEYYEKRVFQKKECDIYFVSSDESESEGRLESLDSSRVEMHSCFRLI